VKIEKKSAKYIETTMNCQVYHFLEDIRDFKTSFLYKP